MEGNFHDQPIALAMAEIGSISERRQARMVDTRLSGLPAFLVSKSGLNSGFMIPQYVSAAFVSENKVLAHPSSVDSIPTSANQEDHVSMGMYSSRKARSILENVHRVVAIEILTASQALEFSKPLLPGKGLRAAFEAFRREAPFVEEDRYLHPLVKRFEETLAKGTLLRSVEESIGSLE